MNRKDFLRKSALLGTGLTIFVPTYPKIIYRIEEERQAIFWAILARFAAGVIAEIITSKVAEFIVDKFNNVSDNSQQLVRQDIDDLVQKEYTVGGEEQEPKVGHFQNTDMPDFFYPSTRISGQKDIESIVSYNLNTPTQSSLPPHLKMAEIAGLASLTENYEIDRTNILPFFGSRKEDNPYYDFSTGLVNYNSRDTRKYVTIHYERVSFTECKGTVIVKNLNNETEIMHKFQCKV